MAFVSRFKGVINIPLYEAPYTLANLDAIIGTCRFTKSGISAAQIGRWGYNGIGPSFRSANQYYGWPIVGYQNFRYEGNLGGSPFAYVDLQYLNNMYVGFSNGWWVQKYVRNNYGVFTNTPIPSPLQDTFNYGSNYSTIQSDTTYEVANNPTTTLTQARLPGVFFVTGLQQKIFFQCLANPTPANGGAFVPMRFNAIDTSTIPLSSGQIQGLGQCSVVVDPQNQNYTYALFGPSAAGVYVARFALQPYNGAGTFDSTMELVTLDNAAMNTVFQNGGNWSASSGGVNGHLFALNMAGVGPTGAAWEIYYFSPNMQSYYVLNVTPQTVNAQLHMTHIFQGSVMKIDSQGYLWFNSNNVSNQAGKMFYSYSLNFLFNPRNLSMNIPPVDLPCYNPCIQYMIGSDDNG